MVSRILTAMAQLGPAVAEQLKQSPLYQTYSRIAPNPENWPVPVTKMGNLLRKDFDWFPVDFAGRHSSYQ